MFTVPCGLHTRTRASGVATVWDIAIHCSKSAESSEESHNTKRSSSELGATIVLGSSNCHNTMPLMGWLNQQEEFPLTVLETESPRPRCRQGWHQVRTFFLGCRQPPSVCPSCVLSSACEDEERKQVLASLLIRILISLPGPRRQDFL